jgi:hypothetical protein
MAKRPRIVISKTLPRPVRAAALRYATDRETDDLGMQLLEAFEIAAIGDVAHRRAVWLCVLAVRRVLYGWEALGCEGDKPNQVVDTVASWVKNGRVPRDWAPLCVPAVAVRDGRVVTDCDINRARPIASAAAHTARFAQSAALSEADEALFSVWMAMDEGVHWPDSIPFEEWLVTIALPAALELRDLSEQELHG